MSETSHADIFCMRIVCVCVLYAYAYDCMRIQVLSSFAIKQIAKPKINTEIEIFTIELY
jgi:hypothetical protein